METWQASTRAGCSPLMHPFGTAPFTEFQQCVLDSLSCPALKDRRSHPSHLSKLSPSVRHTLAGCRASRPLVISMIFLQEIFAYESRTRLFPTESLVSTRLSFANLAVIHSLSETVTPKPFAMERFLPPCAQLANRFRLLLPCCLCEMTTMLHRVVDDCRGCP